METTINTKLQSIVEKTVLLRVNFRIMGNSRKVNTGILSTSANGKLLKIQKTLLESKELEAIKKSDAQMRAILHDMCVPYDMGLDLLPRVSVDSARDKLDLAELTVKTHPKPGISVQTAVEAMESVLGKKSL